MDTIEAWSRPVQSGLRATWLAFHRADRDRRSPAGLGRGFKDRNATLWSSMEVQSEQQRVFFSGEMGLTTEAPTIARALPWPLD
ncbi:MAG: hypothetical protein ACK4NM_10170 [Hydrogenophaga sp.]